jgi:hypothetical protein
MRPVTALVLALAFPATTLISEPAAARFGRSAMPGSGKMFTGTFGMVPARISVSNRPPVPCDCSNCSAQHCQGSGGRTVSLRAYRLAIAPGVHDALRPVPHFGAPMRGPSQAQHNQVRTVPLWGVRAPHRF